MPDAGVGHRVVPVEVDPTLLEAHPLERVVAEEVRVADVDAAQPAHHRAEVLEPGDEDVLRVDADQVADRVTHQLRPAVVERGVDLVHAVAGNLDPGVAGYADDARRVGLGVDRDQLERVAAGVDEVLPGARVGADREDRDHVLVEGDGVALVHLDQRELGRLRRRVR